MTDSLLTLAIDQGTHCSRAMVFDHRGTARAKAQHPVSLTRLSRHRVEQQSEEILRTTREVRLPSVQDIANFGQQLFLLWRFGGGLFLFLLLHVVDGLDD